MVDTLDNGEIPDNLTDHDECRVHSPQPLQQGETDLGHTPDITLASWIHPVTRVSQLFRQITSKYCAQLLL